jgi:hypothetical protein
VREIAGILLMLAALLGVLAILSNAESILGGIRDGMLSLFGTAWIVPVVAAVALSAYLLWPKAPRPRMVDIVAGAVAVLSLIGLFGLVAGAGGSLGRGIDAALTGLFTVFGAWALLIAGLVIGLIVTVHFSPGALLVTALGALRAANAERERIRDLVAAPATEKPKPAPRPVVAIPASEPKHAWDVELDEVETKPHAPAPAVAVADVEEHAPAARVLRVVAEPEDDLPEVEWKLPSIVLLDTVTARRERRSSAM